MKTLMVCTFPHGGATIAARRQAEALRSIGKECSLVSIKEDWSTSKLYVTRENFEITINVPASSWSYSGRLTSAYCNNNRSAVSNTWLSFWPYETFLDEALLEICLEFDVIHFHWFAQMVSTRLLRSLAPHNRRIIFTGHDMNHFTGGCHYSAGCEKFRDECISCPQLIADPLNLIVNSYYQKISSMAALPATWLFPSIWLANEFRKSRLHEKVCATRVTYNCIDTEKFHPIKTTEKHKLRTSFGIGKSEIVYVAGAADNTELRKGFSYIESSIKKIANSINSNHNERNEVVIITFGHGEPSIITHSPFIRHLHLGSINEKKVIELFQCADLLLFPSIEENFSNTILESLMCGCPVFAFNIGGVPDIVEHHTNGYIVESVSHEHFSAGLEEITNSNKLYELHQSTLKWRLNNHEKYTYEHIATELSAIYENNDFAAEQRKIDFPSWLTPTLDIYKTIFGEVRANETNMHSMIAANLAHHVDLTKNKISDHHPFVIPSIFLGLSDAAAHDPLGRVSWLTSSSSASFYCSGKSAPALCLQIPNVDWVIEILERSLPRLQAEINQKPVTHYYQRETPDSKFVYLWIIPRIGDLNPNQYNILSIKFNEPAISLEDDIRGLCILHSQATVFDLANINIEFPLDNKGHTSISSQLSVIATQQHYLWDGWQKDVNLKAFLPIEIGTWIDLLKSETTKEGCTA